MSHMPFGGKPDASWLDPTAHRDHRREVINKCFVLSHTAVAVLV